MLRSILVYVLLAFPLTAQAGDLVLNDLKAQNGIQLSIDDLNALMPNAKVISYVAGGVRNWTNELDGKFIAYSDVGRSMKKLMTQVTAQGIWHIGKNGTYCVTLEWPKRAEKWCKYIFKVDGKYYGVKSVTEGDATALEFEFSQ
jgi:hypothetical protein